MNRPANLIFLFCALYLVASCSSRGNLESFPELQARVADYYSAEEHDNWDATYALRYPHFRNAIPRDRYIAQMQRDNKGWRLVSYQIDSVREEDGKVRLKIRFKEVPPADFGKGHLPAGTQVKEVEAEDESIWILIDGKWYAYAPGTRGRLSLNAPIALP